METYLRHRSGKDNNFIQFSHAFHELVHTGPLDYINVMILAFNLDRYGKVGLM